MFNWFKSLLKKPEKDPLLNFLELSKVFHPVTKTRLRRDKYGKTYCGFQRIAMLYMLTKDEQFGLMVFLRVYRSPAKPHHYTLIWSYGDKIVYDFLYNSVSMTKDPFKEDSIHCAISQVTDSVEAIRTIYSLKARSVSITSKP
jgi:hypothetical protein